MGLRRPPLRLRGQRRTGPSVWGKLRSAAGPRTVATPFCHTRPEPDPAGPSNFDDLTSLQRLNTLSALRQTLLCSRPLRMGHRSSRREFGGTLPRAWLACTATAGWQRRAPDPPPYPQATLNFWHRRLCGYGPPAGAAAYDSASGPLGQDWATAACTTGSDQWAKSLVENLQIAKAKSMKSGNTVEYKRYFCVDALFAFLTCDPISIAACVDRLNKSTSGARATSSQSNPAQVAGITKNLTFS